MADASFQIPIWFDHGATFAFALTGAIAGINRGYDVVGVFFLALASGIGGGLIRDGVFIPSSAATPLLTDPRYIQLIVAAAIVGMLFGRQVKRVRRVIALIDALGLGAYAAFGTQKALQFGLSVPAAILVGVINAAGGGLLRDILTREEPLVFRPGQFYVLTAVAGAVTFISLSVQLELSATSSAVAAIAVTFVFRVLTIVFNWRTSAVATPEAHDLAP